MNIQRPLLVIPELIEQPTWGGNYITSLKKWTSLPHLRGKKIGQSFELYGKSKLATEVFDSSLSYLDSPSFILEEVVSQDLSSTLGPSVAKQYGKMPLLIKLNQAAGNSFQLHIKPSQTHPRWKAKPESWYFLEDGYISCGIQPNISLEQYKSCCGNIAEKMRELSHLVQTGVKSREDALIYAHQFIQELNPWQYIQLHKVKKHDLIDLSGGGVHHSWEENTKEYPLGNIVYEVQLDVMDEFCTIRSFDQGKIKEDGSIREIHIDDYFTFLDSSEASNDFSHIKQVRQKNTLLNTPYYALDIIENESFGKHQLITSFHHLYVQTGSVKVSGGEGSLILTEGHSCFIPFSIGNYSVTPKSENSVVLKTYIP